jgi:hypothetical protein
MHRLRDDSPPSWKRGFSDLGVGMLTVAVLEGVIIFISPSVVK